MRLPYLQVTRETWDYARSLAALTGLQVGAAFMLICDLWCWGLSLGAEDEPPTGRCDNPRAAKLLSAAVGWSGSEEVLVAALSDLGLVEVCQTGLRVRGLGRYKRTWEKNRRNPARPVPVSGTNPAPPAPVPARQTQTQTQTQKEDLSATPTEVFKLEAVPKAKPDRKASAQEELNNQLSSLRDAALPGCLPDERWAIPRINSAFSPMLDAKPDLLMAAYRLFLADEYARNADPPCPRSLFVSQWSKWVSIALKNRKAAT